MDPISQALNTTFESEIVTANSEIDKINSELAALEKKKEKLKTKAFSLEDKEYLEFELKSLIASNQNIKSRLEDELMKQGTKASMFEVYTLVCNTIQNALRELRQLNRDIVDIAIAERRMTVRETEVGVSKNQITGPVTVNNSYILNSNDIDKMIREAQQNSQLNTIEVDFASDIDNVKQ
jgi:hypothetical protein